jgi:hypothetical protein
LNVQIFALERRKNRGRLAASGCPVEPGAMRQSGTGTPIVQEGRTALPLHMMIKLTKTREITSRNWNHPDEERKRRRGFP